MILPDLSRTLEDQSDGVLLRLCLWGEARGEGPVGMLAVAHVIMNRLRRKPTVGVKGIVLQPWQFSAFNTNDPNRAKLLEAYKREMEAYVRADAVAALVENHVTRDPTDTSFGGATHYVVNALWEREKPGAWYGKEEVDAGRTRLHCVVGNHTFASAAPWIAT